MSLPVSRLGRGELEAHVPNSLIDELGLESNDPEKISARRLPEEGADGPSAEATSRQLTNPARQVANRVAVANRLSTAWASGMPPRT